MAFSIFLHLSILPALSATTLWQNTMKCRNAVTEFSQESTCFGSAAGQDAWLAIFTFNERSFATHLELHQNPLIITHVQGLINFYSSFCASQDCVNSYANLVEICFELNQDKLGLDLTLLVDQLVNYSCSTNERGEYCATAQLENANYNFSSVVACTVNQTTNQHFMDVLCNRACVSLARARSSLGCCVSNYFDTLETIFREIDNPGDSRFPDTSEVWSNCGETDPGTCPTTLSNPLRSSGHHVVHSWSLLATVLVFVKVIQLVVDV